MGAFGKEVLAMGKKILKTSKAATALSTAVLIAGSPILAAVHAAGTNDFTLTADTYDVKAGDVVNVKVGFSPDTEGAAGFTLLLHYDPEEVEVYVPAAGDPKFNVGSDFSVITNYGGTEGVVKIVGANLSSSNIRNATDIALAQFTVLDGAEGDIDYWLEVDTIVSWDGNGYVKAPYTAPGADKPLSIDVEGVKTTSQTAPETTTTKEETTTTTTTVKETETTTTTAPAETVTTTTPTETAAPAPETTTEEQTATVTETSAAAETSQTVSEVPVSVTETEKVTEEEPEDGADDDALYSFSGKLEEGQTAQFGMDIYDYIPDRSKKYDIKFGFETTGYMSGGVGTSVNGEWTVQTAVQESAGKGTWVFRNYDLEPSSSMVYMQVYHLAENAEFRITSVEVVPAKGSQDEWYYYEDGDNNDNSQEPEESVTTTVTEAPAVTEKPAEVTSAAQEVTETVTTRPAEQAPVADTSKAAEIAVKPVETEKFDPDKNYVVTKPEVAAAADSSESKSEEVPSSVPEKSADSQPDSSVSDSVSSSAGDNNSIAGDQNSSAAAPVSSDSSSSSAAGTGSDSSKTTPEKVLNTVNSANEQANKNPNTGSENSGLKAFRLMFMAAALEVIYTLFATVYNKVSGKKDVK